MQKARIVLKSGETYDILFKDTADFRVTLSHMGIDENDIIKISLS